MTGRCSAARAQGGDGVPQQDGCERAGDPEHPRRLGGRGQRDGGRTGRVKSSWKSAASRGLRGGGVARSIYKGAINPGQIRSRDGDDLHPVVRRTGSTGDMSAVKWSTGSMRFAVATMRVTSDQGDALWPSGTGTCNGSIPKPSIVGLGRKGRNRSMTGAHGETGQPGAMYGGQ